MAGKVLNRQKQRLAEQIFSAAHPLLEEMELKGRISASGYDLAVRIAEFAESSLDEVWLVTGE